MPKFLTGLCTLLALLFPGLPAAGQEESLPVMSFNVRYGSAPDGKHSWPRRRDAACEMINECRPAVFGVQEALDFQLDYILEHCPGYQYVGVGREDGVHSGEHMSVFYDTRRIALLEWGTYWLSETPDQPSLGWDAACRRTATWTLLKDRITGEHFYFVNTHLDHVGVEARRQGLLLLVRRIGAMNPEGYPMILTGDMNVYPDDPCLKELRMLMEDARETAPETDSGLTYHAWGKVSGHPPIDYVFYKGFAACEKFQVIRQPYRGVSYVSDHYPVAATLSFVSREEKYFTREEMPDLVQCLPAPPDTSGTAFDHDVLRYVWGKRMRRDAGRATMATRDAIWDLDTLAAVFSDAFGLKISRQETPEIYWALRNGVATMEQIRVQPKAYYRRIRPFVLYDEPLLTRWEEEELRGEGSYPSGHTIRGWAAALILSEINPAAAEALFKRGWQYGESRVIVGAHWQSDVDASRPAASIAYSFLQTSPAYRRQVEKARAEFLSVIHR